MKRAGLSRNCCDVTRHAIAAGHYRGVESEVLSVAPAPGLGAGSGAAFQGLRQQIPHGLFLLGGQVGILGKSLEFIDGSIMVANLDGDEGAVVALLERLPAWPKGLASDLRVNSVPRDELDGGDRRVCARKRSECNGGARGDASRAHAPGSVASSGAASGLRQQLLTPLPGLAGRFGINEFTGGLAQPPT